MDVRSAVGFVETRGLIGVIEAADQAVKAADVEILGFQQVGDGIVSVRFGGDVASVQVAVEAAAEAAARVGTVISRHVIPRPHPDVGRRLDASPEPAPSGGAETPTPPSPDPGTATEMEPEAWQEVERLPVPRLRQILRRTPGTRLRGREISRANRATLLEELKRLLAPEEPPSPHHGGR